LNAKTNLTHPDKRLENVDSKEPQIRKTKEKCFTLPINIQMVNYCYLHEQAIQNNFKTPMHPYFKQKTGIRRI
jgi:hypothetical protein